MYNWIIIFLATGFGSGILADTVSRGLKSFKRHSILQNYTGAGFLGTCVGMVFVALWLPLLKGGMALTALAGITVLSVYISGRAEDIFGNKDDPRIVIDEIVGILWTFYWLPPFNAGFTSWLLIAGFVLFRVFDVLKLPFKDVQNFRGGLGIVLDDLLAGLLANVFLRIAIYALH